VVIFKQINTTVSLVCTPAAAVIFSRAAIGLSVTVEMACSYKI